MNFGTDNVAALFACTQSAAAVYIQWPTLTSFSLLLLKNEELDILERGHFVTFLMINSDFFSFVLFMHLHKESWDYSDSATWSFIFLTVALCANAHKLRLLLKKKKKST